MSQAKVTQDTEIHEISISELTGKSWLLLLRVRGPMSLTASPKSLGLNIPWTSPFCFVLMNGGAKDIRVHEFTSAVT